MSWRAARSLLVIRDQVNAAAPGRDTSADGIIGDAAHSSRDSDHNPDQYGIVRAIDMTQDPAHGADMGVVAEALRCSRDSRIKYVIWNRRIFSATISPWTWRSYSGTDPHTGHLHLSVVSDARADETRLWSIGITPPEEDDEMTVMIGSQPIPSGFAYGPDGSSVDLSKTVSVTLPAGPASGWPVTKPDLSIGGDTLGKPAKLRIAIHAGGSFWHLREVTTDDRGRMGPIEVPAPESDRAYMVVVGRVRQGDEDPTGDAPLSLGWVVGKR
jgi:hypothetical protein